MIFGVSGKKQSGKDLVGKIGQYLLYENEHKEINIPTIETFLSEKRLVSYEHTFDNEVNNNYLIKKFADKLKDLVCLITGCTREELEDDVFKNTDLGKEWWNYHQSQNKPTPYLGNLGAMDELHIPTPRFLLQFIGTDLLRTQLHNNVWVNATMSDYKPISNKILKSNMFDDGRLNHGYNKTRIFRIYHNIKQRCTNKNHPRYKDYGGRGIKMCKYWDDSIDNFIKWSELHGYSKELTLDRKDNDKGYEPSNCRWASYSIQAINTQIRSDNKSGYRGVCKDKSGWRADIQINSKRKFLGYFNSAEEASEVYELAFIEREDSYIKEDNKLIYPNFIITDVRFPNEVEVIKKHKGIVIRIERECLDNTDQHASETALDDYNFDYIIHNNGTIDELIEKVREILELAGLIK